MIAALNNTTHVSFLHISTSFLRDHSTPKAVGVNQIIAGKTRNAVSGGHVSPTTMNWHSRLFAWSRYRARRSQKIDNFLPTLKFASLLFFLHGKSEAMMPPQYGQRRRFKTLPTR